MNIPYYLFFLAFAIQNDRSLAAQPTCAYKSGGSAALCAVQLTKEQCQAASVADCVNGADADPVDDKTMWEESDDQYGEIEALVDGGTMDFWGAAGLPSGCYVLKGKNGNSYYFYKTVAGTKTSVTQGDKNICLAGKILNQKLCMSFTEMYSI